MLSLVGLGWKDIHATNVRKVDPISLPRLATYLDDLISLDDLQAYAVNRTVRSIATELRQMLDRLSCMPRELIRKIIALLTQSATRAAAK
jgi:hypothetical protein